MSNTSTCRPSSASASSRDSLRLVRALGYDMDSMEWAIRDGIPYAIDFMNPAPDMDIYSLTPTYFEWAVTHMAIMVIRLASQPRPQARDLRWDAWLTAQREDGVPIAQARRVRRRRGSSATDPGFAPEGSP